MSQHFVAIKVEVFANLRFLASSIPRFLDSSLLRFLSSLSYHMSERPLQELLEEARDARSRSDVPALKDVLAELEELNALEARARALAVRGTIESLEGETSAAMENFHKAIERFSMLGSMLDVADVRADLGVCLVNTGEQESALQMFQDAIPIFEEYDRFEEKAGMHFWIGVVHMNMGEYAKAFEFFSMAREVFDQLDNHFRVVRSTAAIGTLYAEAGDLHTALGYFEEALARADSNGIEIQAAVMRGNIANVHSEWGEYDVAIPHLRNALEWQEANANKVSADITRCNLALTLAREGRVDEAHEYLDAMSIDELSSPVVKLGYLEAQSKMFEQANALPDAADALSQAVNIAKELDIPHHLAELHRSLRDVRLKLNDLEAYVEHNNAFQALEQQVRADQIARLQTLQQKDREMDQARRERERERAVLYSALPSHIADKAVRGELGDGEEHQNAVVVFIDIVDFTTSSSGMPPTQLIPFLGEIFDRFDEICTQNSVTKVKTVGDKYLAVSFQETPDHVAAAAQTALDILGVEFTWPTTGKTVEFRIGMHIGDVVSGVIGHDRLQFDVWGDPVNVASKLEASSTKGRVHASVEFAEAFQKTSLDKSRSISLAERKEIDADSNDVVKTFWLRRI